jgi:hypothetical protein
MTRLLTAMALAMVLTAAAAFSAGADDTPSEETAMATDSEWRFFTDTVMGGVSTGRVTQMTEGGESFLRMTGTVSTANRGGFIQMRTDLSAPPPEGTTGVRLVVRGNGQRYFVHLRTAGTVLPWQYYQAGFDVTGDWAEVRLPFSAFRASGALLRSEPRAGSLTSLAVVAYGRDHEALIDLREAGFY